MGYNIWNVDERRWVNRKYGSDIDINNSQNTKNPDHLTLEQAKEHYTKIIEWCHHHSIFMLPYEVREIPYICQEDCC